MAELLAFRLCTELPMILQKRGPVGASALGKELGVSRGVALKALQILRDRGLIDFGPGKPVSMAPAQSRKGSSDPEDRSEGSFSPALSRPHAGLSDSCPSSSAHARLAVLLRDRILTGDWPRGRRIPSLSHLTGLYRVSRSTATKALRLLVSESLIRHEGRGYTVGPGSHHHISLVARKRIVCIIQFDGHTWDRLRRDMWGDEYVQSVIRGMAGSGLEYRVVQLSESTAPYSMNALRAALRRIDRLIKDSCAEVAGFICLVRVFEFPNEAIDYLKPLFLHLSTHLKPVVWFDPTDEMGTSHPRSRRIAEVMKAFFRNHRNRLEMYRVFPDERHAVKLALDVLHSQGHRRVGLPLYRSRVEWMRNRRARIRQFCETQYPAVRCVETGADLQIAATLNPRCLLSDFSAAVSSRTNDCGILSMVHDMRMRYPTDVTMGGCSSRDRGLASMSAVLIPLMNMQDLTAILAPNDRLARRMFRWLRACGVDVPNRLSLLSFDDCFEHQYPFPVSSINFGFERLGRLTVSILHGEHGGIQKADRGLAVPCFLNHRASISPRTRD